MIKFSKLPINLQIFGYLFHVDGIQWPPGTGSNCSNSVNFGLSENCQKIFAPKMQKFWPKTPFSDDLGAKLKV